jgi:hypothetical protein
MTASVRAGSRPTRSASASASAAPTRLIAASRLLTSLVRAPSPARSPRPKHRIGEARQQQGVPLEHVVPAGDHQAHRSGPRARRAARHRRFDPVDGERVEPGRERFDALGRDGRTEDDAAARRRAGDDAIVAEEHRLGLRRVDDGDDDDFALARQQRRRRASPCALALGHRLAVGADVANEDRAAVLAQPRGHGQTHVADADHARAAAVHAAIVTTRLLENAKGFAQSPHRRSLRKG